MRAAYGARPGRVACPAGVRPHGGTAHAPIVVTGRGATGTLTPVHISPVAPDDQPRLRACWSVEAAAREVDLPWLPIGPVEEVLAPPLDQRSMHRERWLATDADHPIGVLRLHLPQLDNTSSAEAWVVVHPAARRKGVGRVLFDTARARLRELGRTHLSGEVAEPVTGSDAPPGPAFATSVGATRALEEICRTLDLDALDEARLATLEAEATAASAGYELVQWVGPADAALLDGLAWLTARLSTDAPRGDLQVEAQVWDAERIRAGEADQVAMGRRWVTTGALHVATHQLVGYSDIGYSAHAADPAHQWTTIVDPAHRGHRLGLLLKVANVHLLRRENPAARQVVTWNAESNAHMVAINDAMGFRPRARYCMWQLSVPA